MKSSYLTLLVSDNYRNFAVSKHSQLNLSEIIRIGKFLKRFLQFSCSFQEFFVSLHLNTAKGTDSDEGQPSFFRLPQAVASARCDIEG